MANGLMVAVAVLLVSVSILICAIRLYRRREIQPEPVPRNAAVESKIAESQNTATKPEPVPAVPPVPRTNPIRDAAPDARPNAIPNSPPAGIVKRAETSEVQGPLVTEPDRNERILAGISENIRKSLQLRAAPAASPILYSESKRNTEYVRVKKEIITPHGHIRFSILKDWVSTNMLAIFRRAALEWKTPEDLISLLPAYLQPNAEILNDEVLLIGTSGHNEKLAVPVRNLDAAHLRDCFDFISGGAAESNIPAVLLPVDAGFEVVSKGVITRSIFTIPAAAGSSGMKVLDAVAAEALHNQYNVAVLSMDAGSSRMGIGEQAMQ